MKKTKCFIECEMLETPMIQKMEINKKEFEENIKHLMNECEITIDHENPVELFRDEIKEFDTFTIRTVIFHCGCCETYLTKYECKEGYCFKK
jgi:hypothetical protein